MIEIVPASEHDIPLLQQLADESWKENYADILSEEQITYMLNLFYSKAELQKHFRNANYHYVFISNDLGQRLGFMGWEQDFEKDTTKLHRLYLLRAEKGKNLGRFAIQFLKDWVKKHGNHRIILNVNKHNPAKIFYEKCGYSVYNEGIFCIGNNFVMDDYLMEQFI